MLSIDTNLLFHAFNEDSPDHAAAYAWLRSIQDHEGVALSEFVLAEFHGLLRNPAVLRTPLTSTEAVAVVQVYRSHPRWRIVGFPTESRPLHDDLWRRAAQPSFAFRRLFDVRTALTLISQGVTDWATTNGKDFADLGFHRVWNPLVGS
jgi:toxin-antitoxin system PIN domain toxin